MEFELTTLGFKVKHATTTPWKLCNKSAKKTPLYIYRIQINFHKPCLTPPTTVFRNVNFEVKVYKPRFCLMVLLLHCSTELGTKYFQAQFGNIGQITYLVGVSYKPSLSGIWN